MDAAAMTLEEVYRNDFGGLLVWVLVTVGVVAVILVLVLGLVGWRSRKGYDA